MTDAGIVVIGAGPSGIATALGIGDAAPCVVLERRAAVGGLCGTIEIDGAIFDLGGHAFTTPHDEIRALVFGALPMVVQKREARCWVDGTLIEYPFQRHFRALADAGVVADCAHGLDAAAACRRERDASAAGAHGAAGALDAEPGASDFDAYLHARFGAGVARHFLVPYNRKLWARDLRRLASDWVDERVAAPPGAAAPRRTRTEGTMRPPAPRRTPLAEDTCVAYPAHGGYVEIVRALATRVRDLRLETEVARIDLARRELVTARGAILRFDRLVSTIAPADLLTRVVGAPAALRASAAALESVSLALVLAVVEGPVATVVQRIYVADPRILAHKVVVNHASSDSLRARPRHAVTCEIAFSAEKPLPHGDLARRAIADLVAVGVIARADEVRCARIVTIRDAYPMPTHDRAARIAEIRAWLEARGVSTVGRLGEWAYVNADECLRRGLALGRALASATAVRGAEHGRPAPAAHVGASIFRARSTSPTDHA